MSFENKKTLEIYDEKASVYISTGILHDNVDPEKAKRKKEKLEAFIKESFSSIPTGSKILEIGSANGVNAKFIEEIGYDITASDVAEAFIEETRKTGVKTIKFNVLEDKLEETFKGVFCWRVFVHFTAEDFKLALENVYSLLDDNGIFVFNVMNRESHSIDEEWVDFPNEYHMGAERFYRYFSQDEVEKIAADAGYKIESFHKEGGDEKNKWLVYVLRK